MRGSKDFLKASVDISINPSETKQQLLLEAERKVQLSETSIPSGNDTFSQEQTDSIIHNLKVHQIELEMQNDELANIHRELEILKERYFDLYDMAPEGYLIISEKGSIIETNQTAAEILGLTKHEMLNKKVEKFIFHDDQDIYYYQCNLLHGNMNPPACELRMVRRDGTLIWVRLKAKVEDDTPSASCLIIMSDITLRKKAEIDLVNSEKKYKALFSNMVHGLALCEVVTDSSGKVIDGLCIEANENFLKLFKLAEENFNGKRVSEIIERDQEFWLAIFEKVVQTGESTYTKYYFNHLDKYYGIYIYKPENDRFAIIVKDLAENIKQETEILYLSYHDYLTGLYNRRFYAEELMRLDTPRNFPLTLAIGDVNGLKLVNDSLGHFTGDRLLKTISEILQEVCRHDDVIARIGGDEFVIILPKTNEIEANDVISRIQTRIQNTKFESIVLSISFGCATKNNDNIKIEDVFNDAEGKMYHNKLFNIPTTFLNS